MSRVDIVVDVYYATEHAQDTIKKLGITYKKAVPQSIGDCWWFFGVENLPGELPDNIEIRDFWDLNKLVGYGLSQHDADILTAL